MVLGVVLWWSLGFPYITITHSQSVHLVPHANLWTELSWEVVMEKSGNKERMRQIIRDDPSQLTTASPPIGLFPLDYVIPSDPEEIVVLLLLEIEQAYTAEYLVEMAELSIRKYKVGYLKHFQQAVPSDQVEWYKARIDGLIQEHEVDD